MAKETPAGLASSLPLLQMSGLRTSRAVIFFKGFGYGSSNEYNIATQEGVHPPGSGELKMTFTFNRRQALMVSVGAMAAVMWRGSIGPAHATRADAEEAIKKFTGGKTSAQGRVKLDLPEIAENGNTVPMTVSVESPMTAQSHVTDVLIVADGNPRAGVVTFHFSPASGVAEVNTRIRLAGSQNIIAVAKMNDGSLFTTSKQVKVTIGGCGD
jgi:sulfur-oxidizing protein SoxY